MLSKQIKASKRNPPMHGASFRSQKRLRGSKATYPQSIQKKTSVKYPRVRRFSVYSNPTSPWGRNGLRHVSRFEHRCIKLNFSLLSNSESKKHINTLDSNPSASNMQVIPHSVSQFCARARELETEDESSFVDFVLTGRYFDDDLNPCQASVHPLLNSVEEILGMNALRDCDSILAYTKNLPITQSLYVFPVGNAREVLRKSVHIAVHLDIDDVSF